MTVRTLLIGTPAGVYEARGEGAHYESRPLGLSGKGQVRGLLIDKDDPAVIYAGTSSGGVWRSDDRGATWAERNEGVIYRSAWSLAQHPVTGELWLGTEPANVFASSDRGDHWRHCDQLQTLEETRFWTFPRPPHVAHVKNLAVRADDPAWVYGAIEEGWVVRTTNGGQAWVNLKQGIEFDMHQVTVMPDDPSILLAVSGRGAYRSVNGGDSFTESNIGLEGRYCAPAASHPGRPATVYLAAAAAAPPFWGGPKGADSSFYRSDDQGMTWRRLHGGMPDVITAAARSTAVDPEDPDVFAVGLSEGMPYPPGQQQRGIIWLTDDGGRSFRKIIDGIPPIYSLKISSLR